MGHMPLHEAIRKYSADSKARFHVPGHKGRRGNGIFADGDFLSQMVGWDVTELPGLDDLADPDGPILELERRLAGIYGSRESHFLVGGSTLGIQASIMACCRDGDIIVVPRDSHRSVLAGVVLSGAMPYYINPSIDGKSGVSVGPSFDAYRKALLAEGGIKAVVVTNPNYYGVCTELAAIVRLCHEFGALCIVDEAHGAHLRFMPKGPDDGCTAGADLVVQSPHKTLNSLTQTAWLHVCGDRVDSARVRTALSLLQTSSPSYLLMASLESALLTVEDSGIVNRYSRLLEEVGRFKESTQGLGYEILLENKCKDGTRLLISGTKMGFDGMTLYRELAARGVYLELADLSGALAVVTPSDGSDSLDALLAALAEVKRDGAIAAGGDADTTGLSIPLGVEGSPAIRPREALNRPSVRIPMQDTIGMIAAETIAPSPPSIAVLCPGDMVTEDILSAVDEIRIRKPKIHGTADPSLNTLRVLI